MPCETLYWQVPKSFIKNAKMQNVLININVSKNVYKITKMGPFMIGGTKKECLIKI
jgi:hypothetical protein